MEGRTRYLASIVPHAVREFENDDLEWLIHRQIYTRKIDVLQLEYTPLASTRASTGRIAERLFEHDIYFQSIGRGLGIHARRRSKRCPRASNICGRLRYELRMLPHFDQVQVCTRDNKDYLVSFLPELARQMQEGLRAGIDTSRYQCPTTAASRTPCSSWAASGTAERVALDWFARSRDAADSGARPGARVVVIGADPPPRYAYAILATRSRCCGFRGGYARTAGRATPSSSARF